MSGTTITTESKTVRYTKESYSKRNEDKKNNAERTIVRGKGGEREVIVFEFPVVSIV